MQSRNNKQANVIYFYQLLHDLFSFIQATYIFMVFVLVGKYKTQTIADCRAAIKGNNVSSLFKIIKTGSN